MNTNLDGLSPREVWEKFAEIARVPRPSRHEEAIRAYLVAEARTHGIACTVDDAGNVILRKPATPGMESRKGIVLQAHMDMVPQKNGDKAFDFVRDPIEAYVDGEWVKADGTTLGADNGMGMAAILAVLESDDISTPTSAEPWSRASSRRRPNRNERKPFRSPLRSLTLASGFPGSNKPGRGKDTGKHRGGISPDRNGPECKGVSRTKKRRRETDAKPKPASGQTYTGLKKSRVSRHRASEKTRKPDGPARKRNFYKNATKPCTARCNTRFFSS